MQKVHAQKYWSEIKGNEREKKGKCERIPIIIFYFVSVGL